jgi:naphtho-gamma-pyrone polyketide synthase
MALTLAKYLHQKVNKNAENVGTDVRNLEIIKPLIARDSDAGGKEPQIVRITATAERPLKLVNIRYNSLSLDGTTWNLHATCVVEYGDTKSWLADWSRTAYLFRSRIDVLCQGSDNGNYKKVGREQAYDAFSSLVHYNKKYHGMKEVILDSKNFEATSLIEFQATERDGDFEGNPYWIDNAAHISGFVLNGSDAVDSTKQVYISHGWDSLKIARPLSASRSYRNYVKMARGLKQTMVGDVYVFDGDDMVALVGGVKFQAIPRSLLNRLLPPTNGFVSHVKTQGSSPTKGNTHHPKLSRAPEINKEPVPMSMEPSPPTPDSQNDSSSFINEFMGIISEELGLEPSELLDGAAFGDIGLDSLMSLTVSGRVREELGLDVPATLFINYPIIGEAKAAILTLKGENSNENTSTGSATSQEEVSGSGMTGNTSSRTATPDAMPDIMSDHYAEETTDKILSIISEELGIEESELLDIADFADMGVDSLMSLTITGRIREELEMDIPTSFFTDYPNISEAKLAVSAMMGDDSTGSGSATPKSTAEDITPDESFGTSVSSMDEDNKDLTSLSINIREKAKSLPPATSILLQGNPRTASKTLFLFPDGSGSATSYSSLPSIAPDVCVYGLNCPFLKSAQDYTNGIDGVSAQYITEIMRRQKTSPYYLGGWSAGGVIAYEAAYKLMEMGEKIEHLVLIDSPCPINLEPLPSSLLHFIHSMGLLGTQKVAPDWLIPHFEASIVNLAAFAPRPMNPRLAPKTSAIWARDGLLKGPEDRRFPRSAQEATSVKFLLDSRRDLGANGWDKLLGLENITTNFVEGNHFTMIRDPYVSFQYPNNALVYTDKSHTG